MTHLDALLAGYSAAEATTPSDSTRSLPELQRALWECGDPYERGRLLAQIGALLGRRPTEPIENLEDLFGSKAPRQLGGLLGPRRQLLEQVRGTAVE